MGQGFDVDAEAVLDAVRTLRGTVAEFDEITSYAAETDPDPWMWGSPGLVMSQQYNLSADMIRRILGMMQPAFDGILDRITDCCEDYTTSDDDANQEFGLLEEDLGERGA